MSRVTLASIYSPVKPLLGGYSLGMETGIAGYIKERRSRRGWSQVRLAEEVGTSSAYVSQLESGRVNLPGADLRRRLAAALGVTHLDLLVAAGELTDDEAGTPRQLAEPDPARAALLAKLAALPLDRTDVSVLASVLDGLIAAHAADERSGEAATLDAPDAPPGAAGTPVASPRVARSRS